MMTTAESIDHDFNRKIHTGELTQALNDWARIEPLLAGIEPDAFRKLQGPRADMLLGAMVRVFQTTKDNNAALIIQKALLPGTLRLATRMLRTPCFRHLSVDDVIAQVYETLHRIPIANRTRAVAANILLDSRQRLSRDHLRGELTLIDDQQGGLDHASHGSAGDVLVDTSAKEPFKVMEAAMCVTSGVDRFGLAKTDPSNEFIGRRVLVEGHRPVDVAGELGCAPRIVNDRLTRIRRAVRNEFALAEAA